jgi:polysaccharide pyruvyl transferase WcaK-like protein
MSELNRAIPRGRLTVWGSFGFGNAGDEAAYLAIADLADGCSIPLQLDVISRYRKPVLGHVQGLASSQDGMHLEFATQPTVCVGGGVIEPSTNCVLLKCHSFVSRQSDESLSLLCSAAEGGVHYGWTVRRQLRKALARVRHLYVRDHLSAQVLNRLLPKRKVDVVGDIVLWMRAGAKPSCNVTSSGRFIAVCLAPRWSDEPGWQGWISEQLVRISRELKAAVIFVPFTGSFDDDRPEHARIARVMRRSAPDVEVVCITSPAEPREVAAVLGRSILVVGMRLHACVMAISQRVPCIGLAYHPKLIAFAQTMGCDRFFIPSVSGELKQSRHCYGFRFCDTGIGSIDLVRTAREAIDLFDFSALDVMRQRSRDAFTTVLSNLLLSYGTSSGRLSF